LFSNGCTKSDLFDTPDLNVSRWPEGNRALPAAGILSQDWRILRNGNRGGLEKETCQRLSALKRPVARQLLFTSQQGEPIVANPHHAPGLRGPLAAV
jgi:hypothetical protein